MQKIVINRCYGGFGVSHVAFLRLRELGHPGALNEPNIGEFWAHESGPRRSQYFDNFLIRDTDRSDPRLVQVVEELGIRANVTFSDLQIIEIPDDVEWQIKECDGLEYIVEKHRVWP